MKPANGTANAAEMEKWSPIHPIANGPIAPPTTLIINIDEARSVSPPRREIDRAKIVGNMMLSNTYHTMTAHFDNTPSGDMANIIVAVVPHAHISNIFSELMRLINALPANRPVINNPKPPIDNNNDAVLGDRNPSSVM